MPKTRKKPQSVDFSDQLVLFRFFLNLFGKDSLKDFARALNTAEQEGFDENRNTKFYAWLRDFCPIAIRNLPKLKVYDENICKHIRKVGERREMGFTPKYFQYLTLLFTEIYLDRYFGDRKAFVEELNAFLEAYKLAVPGLEEFPAFTEDRLRKIAYMCATGSGKTLIMHVNILQIQHYLDLARLKGSPENINNVILLAPNQLMAEQHLDELTQSGISATIFDKDMSLSNYRSQGDGVVYILDMNKLREEGKEKTVSVDQFEQNNLLFVDEGHRGMSGDVWYDFRTRLGAEGFTFEYSATFKQALRAANGKAKSALLTEYGQSILMDYSYKFFYKDGFGKDYRIYNLKSGIDDEARQLYLIGCLVSFYQQMKVFLSCQEEIRAYNIQRPLLVFVGNRVTASTSKEELTDVEEVLHFFNIFLREKQTSLLRLKALFQDDTGLVDTKGCELFQNVFQPLQHLFGSNILDPEAVYQDILRIVFNTSTTADAPRLHVENLKQCPGELALRVGNDGVYFGVINIGDTAKLMKMCEAKGIVTRTEEFISQSLFDSVNKAASVINLLIGSRKFTEGWNSWRVSTMGLINFAKSEGSQAIQLFGRGVRLRGYSHSLKRSSHLPGQKPPRHLYALETLTIFGVRAQYMEDFRQYLLDEGAPVNDRIFEFLLPTVRNVNVSGKHLKVLRLPLGMNFKKQSKRLMLDVPDDGLTRYVSRSPISIDCRASVQAIESVGSFHLERDALSEESPLPKGFLNLLDYTRIFDTLERYKNEKAYYNLCLDASRLKDILAVDGLHTLIIPKNHLAVDSIKKLQELTDYAILVLQAYMDRFFKYHKEEWENPHLTYQDLEQADPNFVDEYRITWTPQDSSGSDDGLLAVSDSTGDELEDFLNELEALLDRSKGIPEYERTFKRRLSAFDFRHHLYAPLICIKAAGLQIQVSPVALNEDEKLFVDCLKEYTEKHAEALKVRELYLLRNKSKTGIGFFEADNFYPDYILWLDSPKVQSIAFIDPKGLTRVIWDSPKVLFSRKIKERQTQLAQASEKRILLNSFIMSATPSSKLREWWHGTTEEDWLERNVMCLDDPQCVEKMFAKILADEADVFA